MSSAQVLFVVCAMHDAGIGAGLYICSLSCTSVIIIIIAINRFTAQVEPKLAQIGVKLEQIPSKLAQISSKLGEAEAKLTEVGSKLAPSSPQDASKVAQVGSSL